MKLDWEKAVKVANKAVFIKVNRSLTDVEVIVLKGAWQRQEYDEIAAQHQYATSYISQDVAPKLWKLLSEALEEKVKKSNFKQALERYWQKQMEADNSIIDSPKQGEEVVEFRHNLTNAQQSVFLTVERYVEREPLETICYQTLLQPGSLIRIKAPSLMGKTLLVTRILAQAATQGYRTANLSFELADRKTHFTHLDKFLRWFCINLSRELGIPGNLEDYWDEENMGSKVSCTTYFEEYLLEQDENPIALGLDNVDLLFPHPEIYEDFFGLLRSWYEKARSRPRWQKLRLIIVHSTDVYIRLNINQSPFNVGLPIELSEFNREQVQELAKQHGLEGESFIEPIMQLVGGHPYLLEQAFSYLKNHPEIPWKQLLEEAPTDRGIYASHLRKHWLNLQSNLDLAAAFKKVINSPESIQIEPIQAYQLQSMGLVKLLGNQVEPRCDLYYQYFCKHLGDI
jgi:AAA-like domain